MENKKLELVKWIIDNEYDRQISGLYELFIEKDTNYVEEALADMWNDFYNELTIEAQDKIKCAECHCCVNGDIFCEDCLNEKKEDNND